jgi:ribosomal protein L11 methyltransferase
MEKKESSSRTSRFVPTPQDFNTLAPQSSDVPVLQSFASGWIEISIRIHPDAHDALSAFLFDFGCIGLVCEDFPQPTVKGYLPLGMEPQEVKGPIKAFLRQLASIFPQAGAPELSLKPVPEEDWNRTWRRFFRALTVTPHLTVLPSWEPLPAKTSGHIIRIDPGPAFGTGHHATTQMCLQALERLPKPEPWTMLDVGTGSGILAIYGAKLGSRGILALETDPEALRWAEKNIALNEVSNSIHLSSLSLRDVEERFTIVVANLILDSILELMPLFCQVIEPGGHLVLSGILEEQVGVVKEQLGSYAFENIHDRLHDEWVCVSARKRE